MNKNQKGFTLIELVIVVVILGILAAVVVPKYIAMQNEAAKTATEAMAATISSAFATNYAGVIVGATGSVRFSDSQQVLSTAATAVLGSEISNTYSVLAVAASTVSCGSASGLYAGSAAAITVSKTTLPTASATATLICTG